MKNSSKFGTFVSLVIIVGLAGFILVQHQSQSKLSDENKDLRNQIAELKNENQRLTQLSSLPKDDALANEQLKELLRLRGEVGKLRAQQKAAPKPQAAAPSQAPATPAAPPETAPDGAIPRDSWQFVGYATPENAMQSAMWAMSKGDVQTLLNSLTPEAQEAMAKQFENKSEAEIATTLSQGISKIQALRLDRKRVSPNGDITFVVWSEEHDNGQLRTKDEVTFQVQNVGGEWKFSGL